MNRAEQLRDTVMKIYFEAGFKNIPHSDVIEEQISVIDNALKETARDIQCKCKDEDKHGWTTIKCCNECGLSIEKFWTRGSVTEPNNK